MVDVMIALPAPLAEEYARASEQEKLKMQWLIQNTLRGYLQLPPRSLMDVMDEMSARAEARGLTDEILEELLNDVE